MAEDDMSRVTPLSLCHPERGISMLADMERYWRLMRGARRLPVRHDLDPARIDAALPHSCVLERIAPGVARIRVAGQKLSAHLSGDARGLPLSTLFQPASRQRLAELLEMVFDEPALVDLPVLSEAGLGRPPLSGRLLLLPLRDAKGGVTQALGALMVDGPPGRRPRRFSIPARPEPRIERLERRPERRHLQLVVNNG